MVRTRRLSRRAALLVAIAFFAAMLPAACGGSDTIPDDAGGADSTPLDSPGVDGMQGTEAGRDARSDASLDARAEASNEASIDATVDARAEASTDASVDATVDAPTEASADASVDAAIDARAEASTDASVDAAIDARAEASTDASVDAAIDARAEASTDSATDAPAEASTDAGTDSATEAGPCSQAPVVLGAAASFVVLAGSTVTNTGPTSVTGDLGVSPGTAITGFPPGSVVGTQHSGDPTSAQGIADLTTAYNDAAGRTLCPVAVAGNLGGQTLTPGLYKSTSSLEVSSGDLTLDAQGDGNAVFIFQMASTLTTTSGRQVILTNGAKSANVYWQVGTSATLGDTSSFQGTIMADQAITLVTGATLNGRVLARIAAVTLDSNTIVKPAP